jgi:UDP-N-acetylglucosamine 2-epimerase (non-hydrolysing)
MKIVSVVGARPNFMKIAPFIKEINAYNNKVKTNAELKKIVHILVHTGQHYDNRMNDSFFKSLNIPDPDINLGVGSGSHAEQVGKTMIAFEKVLRKEKPDLVVVVGDVNATLACSVTAKKENIKCCHIEAGLRSGDNTMPEEINRLVTDRLSDLLLTPDLLSSANLRQEGVSDDKIKFVGNIMIDTLEANINEAKKIYIPDIIKNNWLIHAKVPPISSKNPDNFALMTLHRPSNVDHKYILEPIIDFLINEVSKELFLIWPIHPRTLKQIKKFNLFDRISNSANIILLHPLNYHDMLRLNIDASIMLTDSGGLQEECSVIGTPCLTLRWNTERPVTLRKNGGVCVLVGNDINKIRFEYEKIINNKKTSVRPKYWDGNTAARCLNEILSFLNK